MPFLSEIPGFLQKPLIQPITFCNFEHHYFYKLQLHKSDQDLLNKF